MRQVWVLAGTSEGRQVCALLDAQQIPFLATVATQYGASLLPDIDVRVGKLDGAQMREMMEQEEIAFVIDATHPYAAQASENAKAACAATGTPYVRIERPALCPEAGPEAAAQEHDGVVRVRSIAEAASYLNEHDGNALIATGGNGAADYTAVRDYVNRLTLRILPDSKVLARCESLGFSAKNIVAMQGPFSQELNSAMLQAIGAKFLVTKDSGEAGGVAEKLSAARTAGATVILVERPMSESAQAGVTAEEAVRRAAEAVQSQEPFPKATPNPSNLPKAEESKTRELFPLFIDLMGKQALVVGGGAVGARRAQVLCSFGARVRILAPELCEDAQRLTRNGAVEWIAREYQSGDCQGCAVVVAATNAREVNAQVAQEAKAANVPVSVADAPDEATFHFPAIVRKDGAVMGLITGNPARTKAVAAKLRDWAKENL